MPQANKKRKRSWRWLIVVAFMLFVGSVGAWLYVKQVVETRIATQLSELAIGRPEIGSISIGPNGVTAGDLAFLRDGDTKPWASMKQLKIEHPISGLAAGDETFDAIVITGLQVDLELETSSEKPFKLSDLKLPAKRLELSNASIVVREPNSVATSQEASTFLIDQFDANIAQTDGGLQLQGTIGLLLGGPWKIEGSASPADNRWDLLLKSEKLKLIDGEWQNLPGLPSGIESYFQADAQAKAEIRLENDPEKGLNYRAEATIEKCRLNIPTLDLPLIVKRGTIKVQNGEVRYKDIIATSNDKDALTVSGTTSLVGFPVTTHFQTAFSDLNVSTLRKLAPAIPQEVIGSASGQATGVVQVEDTLRTTLTLNSNGQSSNASYGLIESKSTLVTVKIEPLVFDSEQQFETIEGSVIVSASAEELPAGDIFSTLDMQDLASQLEIAAAASGNFRLELPLATADNLETWGMQISATSDSGMISQQAVNNIRIEAKLAQGELDFSEITVTPISPTQVAMESSATKPPTVKAAIQWPIDFPLADPSLARLRFTGRAVPADWMTSLVQRQIQNAGTSIAKAPDARLSQLSGIVNFETSLQADPATPNKISAWKGDGSISDSEIAAAEQNLSDLNTQFQLSDGILTVSQLQGRFATGGTVDASGRFNLNESRFQTASVRSHSLPLSWVMGVAREAVPEVASAMNTVGIVDEQIDTQLGGFLNAQFELQEKANGQPWSVSTRLTSDKLMLKGEPLSGISLSGGFDSQTIVIEEAHANLAGRGQFDMSGKWELAKSIGSANVNWQRLPLNWLASFASSNATEIAGVTSGEVVLSAATNAAEGVIPITVSGTVNADELQIGGLKSKQLGFDIRTEGNQILMDRFRSDSDFEEVDIDATLDLKQPFAFALNGTVSQLSLSKVFARPSVTEEIKSVGVTGIANGSLSLSGDLATGDINSTGRLQLENLRVNQKRIRDVSAQWSHLGNDWKHSTVLINALGGSLEMVELNQLPQRVSVKLVDIDASELTAIAGLPVQLTGQLSGEASFNDWELEGTRWADLNLRGTSIVADAAEFGDVGVKVQYRNDQLTYTADGRLLNGKFTAEGRSDSLAESFPKTSFPLQVQYSNGALSQLFRKANGFQSLRPLQGRLSSTAELNLYLDRLPTGSGVVKVNDLTWRNERLTREVSTNVNVSSGLLSLDGLRADLNRGEISGRASIPIGKQADGTYELNVRSFDLQRLLEIVMDDPIDGAGLVDARLSGRLGSVVSGRGSLTINRAELLGLHGRSFRVPVQFQFRPSQQTARFEIRRSRFRMFDGTVAGEASIEFGRTVDLNADLKVSSLNTDDLFSSLAGVKQSGQGSLTGRLKLNGSSMRSARDLHGTFTGSLDRADAFRLPLMNTLTRFLGGNQIQSRDFESEDIDLRLANGKIAVKQLNFANPLVKVVVTGNAYLDGRLDLDVAARVEQINQPTLIEQLVGSPLSQFRGSPVALFAQAADFLSERLVFLQIDGTFNRPIVRPDAGKQLQEEVIRYFLRGSQILPNADRLNN